MIFKANSHLQIPCSPLTQDEWEAPLEVHVGVFLCRTFQEAPEREAGRQTPTLPVLDSESNPGALGLTVSALLLAVSFQVRVISQHLVLLLVAS